jgi:ABC-type transporter MlaC component
MSVLECIDKMELLSTFLDALAAKLLSLTSRKEATAISRDLKDAAKVNLTLALTIKANAQKCAPVGNLLYVHKLWLGPPTSKRKPEQIKDFVASWMQIPSSD